MLTKRLPSSTILSEFRAGAPKRKKGNKMNGIIYFGYKYNAKKRCVMKFGTTLRTAKAREYELTRDNKGFTIVKTLEVKAQSKAETLASVLLVEAIVRFLLVRAHYNLRGNDYITATVQSTAERKALYNQFIEDAFNSAVKACDLFRINYTVKYGADE